MAVLLKEAKVFAPAKTRKIKPWIKAVRDLTPGQWSAAKYFLRTGKRRKGLNKEVLRRISKAGLNLAEWRSRQRAEYYVTKLSPEENLEIRKQMKDFIDLIHPEMDAKSKFNSATEIGKRVRLISRSEVGEALHKNQAYEDIFAAGSMYLRAFDPEMDQRAVNRKPSESKSKDFIAYHEGSLHEGKIVLSRGWISKPYDRMIPIHEAAHYEFGHREYKPYIVSFYYALKRRYSTPESLKKHTPNIKQARAAFGVALRLYNIGKEVGWDYADRRLRMILFGKNKKRPPR